MPEALERLAAAALCVLLFVSSARAEVVREAAVAGAFYPAEPESLSLMLDQFLESAGEAVPDARRPFAILVPHAGFVYSGRIAARAYRLLAGHDFDTVLLLGPFHRALFPGASVWSSGVWKTPLGNCEIDGELAQALIRADPRFRFIPQAHEGEHSLEVQLPFLQKVLRDFKIVPVTVSDPSAENCRALARAIVRVLGETSKKVLIVGSSDLSHYRPDSAARPMDAAVLDLLAKQEAGDLASALNEKRGEMCGAAAALTLLEILKLTGRADSEVLEYATSGDATGDRSSVVGYGAVLFWERQDSGLEGAALDESLQKELLSIARRAIETAVASPKAPSYEPEVTAPPLKENRAVFVTLWKNGRLRGCIGSTQAAEPLYRAVRNMALQAAFHDFRFSPVTAGELAQVKIDISILSPPRKIKDAGEIVLGKHGVIVARGEKGGLFLPKVAEETGWTKEEFLSQLCSQKAGLPRDAWRDPNTQLFIFTTQDFGEVIQ
ncbi:MAG: AmmeMemoRadiSam system protein B [Candidatus Omnitrophica bacterium]|nr:AmmeMemoRadiSam system protein B [Candidatus Omnitrophota bacterium]